MRTRLALLWLLGIASYPVANDLYAQQQQSPGGVEVFAPEFDVGYAMRPVVGMFGLTELMIAALEGNLDEVKRLVEQGANLDDRDDTGGTPLMWAVQGGDIEIVNYLLDSGADVGAVGGRNATAFMIAVISGKEDIGVRLLEVGATFSGELSYQQDYLEYAAANGQATMVRALIEYGADVAGSGSDALCFAVKNRHTEAARALVDAGVDVNQRGSFGNDLPMIHALQTRNQAVVTLLVDAGAELNRKDKADRASIMYYATQTGQPSIVSYLLDNGATIDDQEADQLLGSAVYKGSMEMVDLFVSRGARISSRQLSNAIANKHFDMADAFVDAIGIDSFDDYSLDMLIDLAENSGHQGMVDEMLDVIESRGFLGRPRLLFESVEGENCSLNTWDVREQGVTSTLLDGLPCDAGLFTSRRDSSVFVLQGNRIDVHSLDDTFPAYSLTLPLQGIESRIEELRQQFAQRYAGNYEWVSAEVVTIGYMDDGRISVVTHTGGPADGTYASQFTWDGQAWTLTRTQSCGRFDWICHLPGIDGQSIDRWPVRRSVWHAALRRNPGFVERTLRDANPVDGEPQSAIVFDFNGQRSELGYTVSGSDHCAVECTFTDSVTLYPGVAAPLSVILANSRVSIADRFMLVRPAKQESRLYDLGTGNDVLGDIRRATWVH